MLGFSSLKPAIQRQPRSCWEMSGSICGTTCTSTSPAFLTGTIHPATAGISFLRLFWRRSRQSGTGDGVFLQRNSNNVSRHILLEIYIGTVYVAAPARYVTEHFRLIYITPKLVGSWLGSGVGWGVEGGTSVSHYILCIVLPQVLATPHSATHHHHQTVRVVHTDDLSQLLRGHVERKS